MALTAAQRATLRAYIGSSTPPTDDDLATRLTALGSVEAVALEVLRGRLADFTAAPSSLTLPEGGYSSTANIAALRADVEKLEATVAAQALGAGALDVTTGRLERAGGSWAR